MKIIVVDDDVIMLQAIKNMLAKNGYQVFATTDAQDALDTIREEPFDLVISDIMMPYISGIELLGAIKKSNATVPIVIISALDQQEVILTAFKKERQILSKNPSTSTSYCCASNECYPKLDKYFALPFGRQIGLETEHHTTPCFNSTTILAGKWYRLSVAII
ncbi:MAG: response regulator [Sphingobacteriales bacterium]|nr:response regulator [Sphingobacteriales bacterium]